MKKQIAMIMAAVLAFSNAGSMMAGELIEVEESIVDETIAEKAVKCIDRMLNVSKQLVTK